MILIWVLTRGHILGFIFCRHGLRRVMEREWWDGQMADICSGRMLVGRSKLVDGGGRGGVLLSHTTAPPVMVQARPGLACPGFLQTPVCQPEMPEVPLAMLGLAAPVPDGQVRGPRSLGDLGPAGHASNQSEQCCQPAAHTGHPLPSSPVAGASGPTMMPGWRGPRSEKHGRVLTSAP